MTTLAHGRFSDNAFAMAAGRWKVSFIPFGRLMLDELRSSLRVESHALSNHLPKIMRHLQMYQKEENVELVD